MLDFTNQVVLVTGAGSPKGIERKTDSGIWDYGNDTGDPEHDPGK